MTTTSGQAVHFIELTKQPITPRQAALTVEMWVKVDRQAGKRQFLASLWGPNVDVNDVFNLYINESDQLSFEVNPEGSILGAADNTVVRASATGMYGRWTHVAAVFDGSTASVSLYVDGTLVGGPVTNASYPVNTLNPLSRGDLNTLIGSSNGFLDNQNLNRTLLGMVDEFRLWNRALTALEINCQKDLSLNGNESGLRVYYRCNEPVNNVVQICDATGGGHTGLLRSGTTNQRSDRVPKKSMTVSPSFVTEEIKCDTTRTWTFTVSDTSVCGSAAVVSVRGPEKSLFTITPTNITLAPGTPVTLTLTYRGTNIGGFTDSIEIRPTNRCGLPSTYVKLTLSRITQVGASRNFIRYDTLYVGCKERNSMDSTVTICNTSDQLGSPKPVTISAASTNDPTAFRLVSPGLPLTLAPGECSTFTVRSLVKDTTNDYFDTLRLQTTDSCQRAPLAIALQGRTTEVIILQSAGGGRLPDTMKFENTCPGQLSNPLYYTWQNLTPSPLTIDSLTVPPDFTHYRLTYPRILMDSTGYPPNAVRFRPRNPGGYVDSIVIHTRIQGCTIEKKIYVKGRGLDNKVEWSIDSLIDFGNVIVGQQRTLSVVARNRSQFDTLNISLYVERGEAFTLLSGTGRRIPPMDSTTIPITFRPIDSIEYLDRLCFFETRCYTVGCIPLRGKGILETFRFSPLVMETQGVVACSFKDDTVHIVNLTQTAQTITNVTFQNPSTKFTALDPPLPWSTFTIPADDSIRFIFRYTPNDVTQDRADRAFIAYKSASLKDWQCQLIGTSATPRLFITSYTAFGTVEVGDTRNATLIVENTSALPVLVDSLSIGAGFTILGTSRVLPITLQPRDSIRVDVQFAPTASTLYNAKLTAHSENPCSVKGTGDLNGRGVIIELESALSLVNFGYIRPCECSERTIELLNGSLVFDMTVENIWVDSTGVPGGKPQFYSWTSVFSPTGTVPYTIPPGKRDTVTVKFCPNTPAIDAQTEVKAAFHVKARGSQWSKQLETFLFGKRAMTFKPAPVNIQFPYGVIDVMSPTALNVNISIPSFLTNPSQDTVVIDSVTFLPNDRVFFVTSPITWPQVIEPGDSLRIQLRQRPRAPRDYRARLVLHYSKPCVGQDTTVLIRGGGFAQPKGLTFSYNLQRTLPDTFALVSCDTVDIPIWSSITIDASVVDIMMRVDFDSTQVRLLEISSPLLQRSCTSATGGITYTPDTIITPSPYGGLNVVMKNVCGIDSLSPIAWMRFVTVNNNRANSRITIDSINFDTEDVILYKLIATGDRGVILGLKSEIQIRQMTAFDSVRILDCVERTVTVFNSGDLTNTIDDLLDLPLYTSIVSSVPPLGDSVRPGDSAMITIRFCPQRERSVDTNLIAVSASPCETRDTSAVTGYGYAPELDLAMAAMKTFWVPDSLGGTIGDTIEVPVMVEKDISATYGGITYWMNALSFDVELAYNARALKFIDATFLAEPGMIADAPTPGRVRIQAASADTIQAGELARLRFVVTVPEFDRNDIAVSATGFLSDSLQFLDIVPQNVTTPFITSGSCNITVVKFSPVAASSIALHPNPVLDDATVVFSIQETVPVFIELIDANGQVVRSLMDGRMTLSGGEYAVRFNTTEHAAGVYHLRLSAGVFNATVPFVIVK
ncbi:MAG: choice-of-anchor D domain-containing protein [bacterium]|nr:choice-of-anchor D domain-containing protein [bacterium]